MKNIHGIITFFSIMLMTKNRALESFLADIKPKRLEAAKRMGAHRTLLADGSEPRAFAQRVRQTMGCMPEVSLECSGVESALASAIYVSLSGYISRRFYHES